MSDWAQELDPSSRGRSPLDPSSELEDALAKWFEQRYGPRIPRPKPCEDLLPKCGNRILLCGPGLFPPCMPEVFQELTVELPKCGPDFYIQCNFDRLIRICPFDPAWEAFEWKRLDQSQRLEALEVQIKELQAMLPKGK
jgi:hypothetical protein